MFRSLLLATAIFGSMALPAMAGSNDLRFGDGPPAATRVDWNGSGWNGSHRSGWRMSPGDLARSLRYQGFYNVQFLDNRGRATIFRASAHGRDYVVAVDAHSGEVLRQNRIDHGWKWRPGGPGPGWGGPGGWGNW
jgi:hypothetical protein